LLETLQKGIGAKVINYFFADGVNIIYGDAVDSLDFWEKMGAKFDEFDEDINGYPFTISKEDFMQTNQRYDIIFDAVGKCDKKKIKTLLNTGGIFKSVEGLDVASETKEQLLFLKKLYEAGKLKAVIDKTYSFEEVVEAHRYVDSGRKKGNVVLKIGKE
jgi:NADPH:quinone reductase-like Zn-dependent oxidoreductase